MGFAAGVDGTLLSTTEGNVFTNQDISDISELLVYPNPAHGKITLILNEAKASGETSIRIFSMNGVLHMNMKKHFPGEAEIDIQWLDSGIYILQVQTKSGFITKKLVVY
jgi:hypothetical protein